MERIPIYLDSNVIIDTIEGRDDELLGLLFRSLYCGPYCYPFSAELISEITDAENSERNNKRLMFIEDLSKRVYFENSYTSIGFRTESPAAVFNTINDVDIGFDYNRYFSNMISFDQIIEVRNAFGFNPEILNNMEPLEAIRHIDQALENHDYQSSSDSPNPPRSLKDMISVVSAIMDENFKNIGAGFGNKAEHNEPRKDLILLFSLLDTFGYWGDPRKKYVRGSRLPDAQHALVGSYFSGIVSRDRHLLKKSSAVYEYMGISTKTYTTIEFKGHLQQLIQSGS